MALLDAGVPLKNPVAGLSIGLVTSDKLEKAFPLDEGLPSPVSTVCYRTCLIFILFIYLFICLFD